MDSKKILVIDDSKIAIELISEILKKKGFIVETAVNGAEGYGKYANDPDIDLILSDMKMPVLNGLELIKKLRDSGYEVPLIILTSSNEVKVALDAISLGASDYIIKDENMERSLLRSVNKTLEKKAMQDQNAKLIKDLAMLNSSLETTVYRMTKMAVELSSRMNLLELYGVILSNALSISKADLGAVFISQDGKFLFREFKCKSKKLTAPMLMPVKPEPMEEAGLFGNSTKNNRVINLHDIYKDTDLEFDFIRKFDSDYEYRSKSALVLPMLYYGKEPMGVILLVNCIDSQNQEAIPFPTSVEEIANALAQQAASAIKNRLFLDEMKSLNSNLLKEISEKEKAEEKLKEHQAELENIVKKRTQNLSEIVDNLEVEITVRKQVEEELRHLKTAAEKA